MVVNLIDRINLQFTMGGISIKRVIIGSLIGGIITVLIIFLITYLWLPVDIVVRFKPGINKETAESILSRYDDTITVKLVWFDEESDYFLFVLDIPHRSTGYFVKMKLNKETNIESAAFDTFPPRDKSWAQ